MGMQRRDGPRRPRVRRAASEYCFSEGAVAERRCSFPANEPGCTARSRERGHTERCGGAPMSAPGWPRTASSSGLRTSD
eukprot:2087701-Prymnesium_polylepis.1